MDKQVNVYDFDKTIYDGDCTLNFYIYSIKKNPLLILLLPYQLIMMFLYKIKIIHKTKMKEGFYIFLKYIKDIDKQVKYFWDIEEHKIFDYYKKNQKIDDVIISASPEFLVNEMCERLAIKHVIGSKVDKITGITSGENCYGAEKVIRFNKEFKDYAINEFYSDSKSDTPLADLAKNAYIVKDGKLSDWNN